MRKQGLVGLVAVAAMIAGRSAPSGGATVVQYGFTDNSLAPTVVARGVDASDFDSSGITGLAFYTATTGSASGPPSRTGAGMNTFSDSADLARYWTITVAPQDGASVTLDGVSFYYARENNNSATRWFLRTSVNDYAANLVGNQTMSGTGNAMTYAAQPFSLTFTEPVTLRLYTCRASGSGSHLRLDDVTLTGTVRAPLRGTMFLLR